jgi:hypothetical protein
MRVRHGLPTAGLLAILGACTTGPYQNLATKLDVGVALGVGSTTWIAATPQMTQFLVLGSEASSATPTFMETTIGPDNATVSHVGTYSFDSKGTSLTLSATLQSVMANELQTPVLKRQGSSRRTIAETNVYGYHQSGNSLMLTGTPALGPFTFLPHALSGVGEATEHDAACTYQLVLLTLNSSEARIPGFNGPGTTQYFSPATFTGALEGHMIFGLYGSAFSPHSNSDYFQFSDFDGIVLGHTLSSQADTNGDGYLYGTLSYQFSTQDSPMSDAGLVLAHSGTIYYGKSDGSDAVPIMNGAISGGALQVTMGSTPTIAVPHSSVAQLDVSGCLAAP